MKILAWIIGVVIAVASLGALLEGEFIQFLVLALAAIFALPLENGSKDNELSQSVKELGKTPTPSLKPWQGVVISIVIVVVAAAIFGDGEKPVELTKSPPQIIESNEQAELETAQTDTTKETKKIEKKQPTLKGGYGACLSEELFDQLSQATVNRDEQGFEYLLSNGCVITTAGHPISVLDTTWTGTAKIRVYVDNQAIVLWTYIENIEQ